MRLISANPNVSKELAAAQAICILKHLYWNDVCLCFRLAEGFSEPEIS